MRNQPQKTRLIAIALTVASILTGATSAKAQNALYADYPQKRGKVQPLEWRELPAWMTIGMELRGRTEGETSYNYGNNNDRVYELTRAYGSLEIRPTKFATGYLQFIDTHALGLPTHIVASNMRDAFDLRQGYLNLYGRPGGVPVKLFTGRQELKFGSERIIGISDFTNNSRSWDGFHARIGGGNRVDLFSTSVVTVYPTSLDKHGAGLTFHGAYGSIATWIPHVHVSPYLLFRTVRGVTSQRGVKGNEVEATYGAEVEGILPANLDYIVNAGLQRGSYSTDSIHSGQAFEKIAYTARDLPWKPRIGYEYDYATGNAHRNPNRIGTYDNLYPSNHNAFGLEDLFGYQNITQKRINLDLGPASNLSLLIQGGFLRVASQADSVYAGNASVAVKAPAAGFATGGIGRNFDASAKYVFHNYLVANIGVSHFFPGQLMRDNAHGAPLTYGFFSLTYRFRVDRHAPNPNQPQD